MKKGDKGIEVLELQELLIEHNFELPEHGADGIFGEETSAALGNAGTTLGCDWYDPWGNVQPHIIHKLVRQQDSRVDDDMLDIDRATHKNIPVYDLRGEPFTDRVARKFKRRSGRPVERDPAQVTGITIHQTAVNYGVAPFQVAAAGGDSNLALARRSLRVACHVMAFQNGTVAWPNPLEWYVYHGNGFNSCDLGLEIDGNYPGVKGGRTWNDKKPTSLSPFTIRAACAAIELLVIKGRGMGMPIEYIHAHRQSSATRKDDPGEELWKAVVLEFAVATLGLRTEPERTLRQGRPIPKEWDPNGVGDY